MTIIRADTFKATPSGGGTRLTCTISGPGSFPETLWMERSAPAAAELSGNWALVALLWPAMAYGADLHCEAPCSAELLHALRHDVQSVLRGLYPSLKRVEIEAPSRAMEAIAPHGAGTGFSAGIDSFATLALYDRPQTPESLKVRYLMVHNVGAMGPSPDAERLYLKYLDRLTSHAQMIGARSVGVNSNLDRLYSSIETMPRPYQANHTLRGVATAMACEDLFTTYLYSSTYPYKNVGVFPTYDIAYADPVLLPLLEFRPAALHQRRSRAEPNSRNLASWRHTSPPKVCSMSVSPRPGPASTASPIAARAGNARASSSPSTCWTCLTGSERSSISTLIAASNSAGWRPS